MTMRSIIFSFVATFIFYFVPVLSRCSLEIKHCCIGHCRMNGMYHPKIENSSLGMFGGNPWSNLSKLFSYLNESGLGCRITFAGDSTISDTMMAAACQLMNNGYNLQFCSGGFGYKAFTVDEPFLEKCLGNKIEPRFSGYLGHIQLSNKFADHCRAIDLVYLNLDRNSIGPLVNSTILKIRLQNHTDGILLMNWGLHCNDEGCLHKYMKKLTPQLIELHRAGYKVLWKETYPQHFLGGNNDGTYNETVKHESCGPIVDVHRANWRNRVTEHYLALHHNTTGYLIPVVPVFQEYLDRHWMHLAVHKSVDCTHFCYVPGRFTGLWERMVAALKLTVFIDIE